MRLCEAGARLPSVDRVFPLFIFLLASAALAPSALAAPTARFTATPVQGDPCVAPCAVHFDATATSDPAQAEPWRTHRFAWDFGDPNAGTWSVSGLPKNAEDGGAFIAGHLYTQPGTYTARLTVTAPDGTSHAAAAQIVVADGNTVFSGSNTCCIARAGSFAGCPAGAAQITRADGDFDAAMTASAPNGCDVDGATRKRVLVKRGETGWTWNASVDPRAGSMIGAFGTGARPAGTLSGAQGISLGVQADGVTVADLDFDARGAGMMYVWVSSTSADRLTLYNMRLANNGAGGCVGFDGDFDDAGETNDHPDLFAAIDLDCQGTDTRIFSGFDRQMVLGFKTSQANGHSLRTINAPKSVFAHSSLHNSNGDGFTIRSWGRDSCGSSSSAPPASPTEYVRIAHNVVETSSNGLRTCVNNECTDCGRAEDTAGESQRFVIESNMFRVLAGHGGSSLIWVQGGDHVIRNNVLDLQGAGAGPKTPITHNLNDPDASNRDDVQVIGNTIYSDELRTESLTLCNSSSGSGHLCLGNLGVVPGQSGSRADFAGSGSWNAGISTGSDGNYFSTAASGVFAGVVPQQGATTPANFQLASTSAARNQLSSMPASASWQLDHGWRCRPASGDARRDAGAWEQGASACGTSPPPPAVCGNRLVEAGETCDDGNLTSGDGCSATCSVETAAVCGNGVRETGEGCDDGNLTAGDGCNATCRVEACGNGVRDAGEACDDGNLTAGDGCNASCRVEACGNGVLDAGETCDDGNLASGDGCSATCSVETAAVCGNGVREAGEACDDGNLTAGDGCNATCRVEACGNGVRDAGEACDDGNLTAGDGCNAICRVEACGNGVRDAGEACDDGNVTSGDGCSATCSTEIAAVCGNGVRETGEGCDDGNLTPGDGCDATCLAEGDPGTPDEYYVDVGGSGYTDTSGRVWLADGPWVQGGRVVSNQSAVAATENDPLFWSRRYGATTGAPLTFEFPLQGTGPYRLRLLFAELDGAVQRRGDRVFDVMVEDSFVISDLDVMATAGWARAYAKDFYVNVDDGRLTVRFLPIVGEPMISAIEITRKSPPTSAPRFVCSGPPGQCR